ncbi:hypothetical protein EUX98_g1923 [Antrodiella citrinella]|uniref:Uncharacterized protein n=1 Tax=Antrodiella citrinella TaxID=2447956 RepID=A0A4V3XJA4_9APHY|nr:hypothetical protein EUX98_g1923 [Antrodiella citrinella]
MSDPRRNDLSQNQASTLGTTSDAYVDLMHGEGQEVEVDEFDNLGPQRACFACVTNLSNTSQAYFFCLNRYVLVDLAFGMTIQGPALLPPFLADMLHDPDHASAHRFTLLSSILPDARRGTHRDPSLERLLLSLGPQHHRRLPT